MDIAVKKSVSATGLKKVSAENVKEGPTEKIEPSTLSCLYILKNFLKSIINFKKIFQLFKNEFYDK